MNDLTAKQVRDVLDYDPETGEFVWLKGKTAGKVAGCLMKDGYRAITINRRMHYAHRLAWLHVNGEWPQGQLDHRDGDRLNNRVGNLRPATTAKNAQNRTVYRNNKSGFMGVTKRGSTYIAQIMVDGNHRVLGYRKDPSEAHELYLAAKARLHSFQPVPRSL